MFGKFYANTFQINHCILQIWYIQERQKTGFSFTDFIVQGRRQVLSSSNDIYRQILNLKYLLSLDITLIQLWMHLNNMSMIFFRH